MELEYKELLTKFFAKEISDDELILLRNWLENDSENRHIFDKENEIWNATCYSANNEHFDVDSAWINLSSRLGIGKNNSRSITILNKNTYHLFFAAASIACMLALGGISLWIGEKTSYRKMANASSIISTNEGEKVHILLADSTKIFINSGSEIQYHSDYNVKDRIVHLTGEAFFEVSTNHTKPFVVQTGQITISATGTRFNVSTYNKEDQVQATLEEGIINVSVKGKKPISIEPGQQFVYYRSSEKIEVRNVATDVYTSWKENKLRLNNTQFEEALLKIARKYNVTFEITNNNLLKLSYTATFIDESIEEVMQMLKTVSPITYKIYYRTSEKDKHYLKPRIVVGLRKSSLITKPN